MDNEQITPRGDILIIDDKPANLQLLSSILKEHGHTVRAVVSGAMGLIAARTVKPDLILLDIRMPEMDGYEVCRQIKADETLCSIPVVFISSLEEVFDKVKAFQSGGVDYITKPFQLEEVIARVESQLALYHLHRQAEKLAIVQERERLARDLHDAVSQTLFSASVVAETLLFQNKDQPEQIEIGLEQIYNLTQTALAEMRVLLVELRPDTLIRASLKSLLEQLGGILRTRANVEVVIEIEESLALPQDVHITFYRIAQEAINNITRHAQATWARIALDGRPHSARLIIEDNGRGFLFGEIEPGHLGLLNIQERAEKIGADLAIDSAPGQGTRILLEWRDNEAR
ncbi:MAG: response regulator [Anaerolineae bacterium]|nr:response regulator [Anaerolineae bacterium]